MGKSNFANMQKFQYLIRIQFLGFRYSGWFVQPGQLTVQKMVNKTVAFVLGPVNFKTLGCSRTDAKVSANQMAFELFLDQALKPDFLEAFNTNLPSDIRALSIEQVDESFNIIQAAKTKEYLYLFAHGQKAHPFSASMVCTFSDKLDIELMQKGAKIFVGTHNFKNYIVKPSKDAVLTRKVMSCSIVENTYYNASFFPEKTFALKIMAQGFGRNQVRLMMGQLVELGKGIISLEDIIESLKAENHNPVKTIAPASALILQNIDFDNSPKV